MVVGAGFGLRAGLWKQQQPGQTDGQPVRGWQRWRARAAAWLRDLRTLLADPRKDPP
jgi:hypothetical protein